MVDKIRRAKTVEYSIVFVVSIIIIIAFPQTRSIIDKILETISTQVVSSLGGIEE